MSTVKEEAVVAKSETVEVESFLKTLFEGHIAEGDYVLIRKQETADNGEKVVAMIEKAMTLKKYYKKKNEIHLHPMNSTMEPIVVDPSREDIRILGVLTGVIRKC